MSPNAVTVMNETQCEMKGLMHGIIAALLYGMTTLNDKETAQCLAALTDAYKFYMSQARYHRAKPLESQLWLDKANAVESLSLSIQRKDRICIVK